VQNDLAALEQLRSRPVLRSPERLVEQRAQEVFLQVARGRDLARRLIDEGATRTAELRASLRALSPQATLSRGYAIAVAAGGAILRDADDAPAGTRMVVTLERGRLAAISDGADGQAGAAS
jgi:exodeoxyribonuclease VII large subunit